MCYRLGGGKEGLTVAEVGLEFGGSPSGGARGQIVAARRS